MAEAVPHFSDNLDLEGLRSVLANLNFALHEVRIRQDRLHPSMLPCIFVPDTGAVRVVLSTDDDGFRVYDGWWREERVSAGRGLRGTAYVARSIDDARLSSKPDGQNWMASVFRRFSNVIPAYP